MTNAPSEIYKAARRVWKTFQERKAVMEYSNIQEDFDASDYCTCDEIKGKRKAPVSCDACKIWSHYASLDAQDAIKMLPKEPRYIDKSTNKRVVANFNPVLLFIVERCSKSPRYQAIPPLEAVTAYFIKNPNREDRYLALFAAALLISCIRTKPRASKSDVIEHMIDSAICTSSRSLIAELYKDEDLSIPKSKFDTARWCTAKFLLEMLSTPSMFDDLYSNPALTLVMRCWSNIRSPPDHYRVIDVLLYKMIVPNTPDNNKKPDDYLRRVHNATDIPSWVARVQHICKQKDLVKHKYMIVLTNLFFFFNLSGTVANPVICAQPFAGAFIDHDLQTPILNAVHLILMEEEGEYPASLVTGAGQLVNALFILAEQEEEGGRHLFCHFLATSAIVDLYSSVIRYTSASEVAARHPIVDPWINGFQHRLEHTFSCTCDPENPCGYSPYPGEAIPYPEIQEGARTAFSRTGIPTLVYLQSLPKDDRCGMVIASINVWWSIMYMFDICVTRTRHQHRLDKACNHYLCPIRLAFKKPTRHSTCANCSAVFYCTRECQKKDWPLHREECSHFKRCKDKGLPVTPVKSVEPKKRDAAGLMAEPHIMLD